MSARSHRGGGGLLGALGAPGVPPGDKEGGVGPGDPPALPALRARLWRARGIWGSLLGLGVPQLGAALCPKGLLGELGPAPPRPRYHFKGDLRIFHLSLLCPLVLGIPGLPPSQGSALGIGGARLRPGEASARGEPVHVCPPPSLPSRSPPGTLKVLKVKYYRLLCCCLTTTDKLRTSCQNVSAQQINIQNESQRYVVYN